LIKVRINKVNIQNFGCLRDISFECHPLTIFIGSNGQGKSLIVEAIYRFFNDFNVVGGGSQLSIADSLWHKRDVQSPIIFNIDLTFTENEIKELLPFEDDFFKIIKIKAPESFNKIKVHRSLDISGNWKTIQLSWANIPLVSNDVFITPDEFKDQIPDFLEQIQKTYIMYFFTEGKSKSNVDGDRIIVNKERKIAYTSNETFDKAVRDGIINFSNSLVGEN